MRLHPALLLLGCCSTAVDASRALQQLARVGGQLADSGRHAEAVTKYRAALGGGQMQNAEVVTYNLGLSLSDLGRYAEAAGAFDDTAAMLLAQPPARQQPERIATVHVAAAESRTRTQEWAQAAQHFAAAATLRPGDATVLYNAGSALFNLLRQLLAAPENDPQKLTALANDAGMAFEAALSLRPTELKFLGSAGLAHAMAGQRAHAVERLDAVLGSSGGNADLHMYLALALETTESPELAVPHYARVLAPVLQQRSASKTPPSVEQLLRHATLRLGKLLTHSPAAAAAAAAGSLLPVNSTAAAATTSLQLQSSGALWSAAVSYGLWVHPRQRPGYVVPRVSLTSQPWWDTTDLLLSCAATDASEAKGAEGAAREGRYRALSEAIRLLEHEAVALAQEFRANRALSTAPQSAEGAQAASAGIMTMTMSEEHAAPHSSVEQEVVVVADNEGITDAGWWRQCLFVRNGQRVPANWRDSTERWPVSRRVFEALLAPAGTGTGTAGATRSATAGASGAAAAGSEPRDQGGVGTAAAGVADRLPKGSIEFSMLSPGAHLKTHCGPTNHRLRLHLPILLPPPTAGTPVSSQRTGACEMRVGAESRPWVAGRVSLFDDSYDHEVWNNATSERVVLLIDVWHPDLDEAGRRLVRDELEYSTGSWWSKGSPFDRQQFELAG